MADEKKKTEELTDEEINEAAGGFVIPAEKLGFVKCATEGCTNKFRPKNGETLCETCRKKAGSRFF